MENMDSINELLKDLIVEMKTTKKFIRESFESDFKKLIGQAWQQPAEKQLIKILYKNQEKILQDETQGKTFISQLFDKNKSLIQSNCSDDFVNMLKMFTDAAGGGEMMESVKPSSLNDLYIASDYAKKKLNEGTTPEDYMRDEIVEYINNNTSLVHKLYGLIIGGEPEEEYVNQPEEELAKMLTNYCLDGGLDDGETQDTYELMSKRIKGFGNLELLDTIQDEDYEIYEESNKKENKQNRMYRFYKVQYLNESKYVAVPPFAVNALNEHDTVLQFALESKQLKTSKGVDYVVEVSEQEFDEVSTDIEGKYGAEPKDKKPQDASKASFDSVKSGSPKKVDDPLDKGAAPKKTGKEGAKQTDPKKLQESRNPWSFLYENDEADKKGMPENFNTDTNGDVDDDFDAIKEAFDNIKEQSDSALKAMGKTPIVDNYNPYELGGGPNDEIGPNEFYEQSDSALKAMGKQSIVDSEQLDEIDHNDPIMMRLRAQKMAPKVKPQPTVDVKPRVNKAQNDLKAYYAQYGVTPEEAEANPDFLNGYGEIEEEQSPSALHAMGKQPIVDAFEPLLDDEDDIEADAFNVEPEDNEPPMCYMCSGTGENMSGTGACQACGGSGIQKQKRSYNESDTSGIDTFDVPVTKNNRASLDSLNVYGEDNDEEHLDDADVLQENFARFVLNQCQGARQFLKNGKFYINEFFKSKTYGYKKMVLESFKGRVNPQEPFSIEDVYFDGTDVRIDYVFNGQQETYDTNLATFFEYAQRKDPNWENFFEEDHTGNEDYPNGFGTVHNLEAYWNAYDAQEQTEYVKNFLQREGIVAEQQ